MHKGVDNSFSLLCLKMLRRMCEWWKNLQPKCWSGVCQDFALLFKVIWERRLHAQTRLWLITAKLMQFQALRWFIATISPRVCLFPFSQRNRILKVDQKKLIKLISVTWFSVLLFNCCAWNGSCQIYYLLSCVCVVYFVRLHKEKVLVVKQSWIPLSRLQLLSQQSCFS